MNTFKEIQSLSLIFPEIGEGKYSIKKDELIDFPLWLRKSIDAYLLRLGDPPLELILIKANSDYGFEKILNIYKQLSTRIKIPILFIMHNLKPKLRPLLVKYGISFIDGNKYIYAPELGVVLRDLNRYHYKEKARKPVFDKELHPLSVKLLSAYLTHQLPKHLTLKFLNQKMIKMGGRFSLSKLSQILNELVKLGYMETHDMGPHKKFVFKDVQKVWEDVISTPKSKMFRVEYNYHMPEDKSIFVLVGETALAEYSDLAQPNVTTVATSSRNYKKILEKAIEEKAEGFIQIWKEDPKLFSIEGKINSVELYFSLQNVHDERIQSALEQMLKKYSLAVPGR